MSLIQDNERRAHRLTLGLAYFLILPMACSQVTRVPPTQYGNPGEAAVYHVTTVDGIIYPATRFIVSDSTLVIEAFYKSQETSQDNVRSVPFEIPLSQVKSVDRVTLDRGRASVWVFGVGVLMLAVLFFSGMSVNLS